MALTQFQRQARRVPLQWRHPMQRTWLGRDEFVPLFPRTAKRHHNPLLAFDSFMPDWESVAEEKMGFQLFETQTAGTPVSPIFETEEALAAWLAGRELGLVADVPATKEEWLEVIRASADTGRAAHICKRVSTQ